MSARTGLVHLAVAVALGAGVGTGAVVLVDHQRDSRIAERVAGEKSVEVGDRLGEAIDALLDDGVYVADDGRRFVDEDGERAIEAAVAAQEVPTYVIVWAPEPQIGMDGLIVQDLLERELPDEDGFVFVWEGPQEGDVINLGPSGGYPTYGTSLDFVGDPATTLVDAVSSVSRDDFYSGGDDGDDYWGGAVGGSVLGLLLGSTILAVLLVVGKIIAVRRGRRRLLPGGWGL